MILCFKLNGKPLTGERGGPVRMIVPEAYGFKSIKWIQTLFLTNDHQASDTYAKQNNDIDSRMKTYARIMFWPKSVPSHFAGFSNQIRLALKWPAMRMSRSPSESRSAVRVS